jgi:hypothetical protein
MARVLDGSTSEESWRRPVKCNFGMREMEIGWIRVRRKREQ